MMRFHEQCHLIWSDLPELPGQRERVVSYPGGTPPESRI
jgi:hypothetical protein